MSRPCYGEPPMLHASAVVSSLRPSRPPLLLHRRSCLLALTRPELCFKPPSLSSLLQPYSWCFLIKRIRWNPSCQVSIDTFLLSSRTFTLVCAISYAEFTITKGTIKIWPLPTLEGSMDRVNYNPSRFTIFQQSTGHIMVKHGESQTNSSSSRKTRGLHGHGSVNVASLKAIRKFPAQNEEFWLKEICLSQSLEALSIRFKIRLKEIYLSQRFEALNIRLKILAQE